MQYKKFLKDHVTIATYSPRQWGERAAFSKWKEVALPTGFAERCEFINQHPGPCWLKTATKGGRARFFVMKETD